MMLQRPDSARVWTGQCGEAGSQCVERVGGVGRAGAFCGQSPHQEVGDSLYGWRLYTAIQSRALYFTLDQGAG